MNSVTNIIYSVTWAAAHPPAHPGSALGEDLGELRFSLSLFPGLFPRGELRQPRMGPVLRLALGLGATKPGPGDNSTQRFRAGHGAWAGGLFPGRVKEETRS